MGGLVQGVRGSSSSAVGVVGEGMVVQGVLGDRSSGVLGALQGLLVHTLSLGSWVS